jgi:hypothetical protein
VLLTDAAQRLMCARQSAMARQREEERQDEIYRKRWRDAANRSVSPVAVTPIVAWSPEMFSPHVSDDRRTLILVDEVSAPVRDRRPEISLGTDERSGSARVRIAGAGIAPLPAIDIACAWSRRSIPLTEFSDASRRSVASYQVDESIAGMARSERGCRLALAGTFLPLPRELVLVVWRARAPR